MKNKIVEADNLTYRPMVMDDLADVERLEKEIFPDPWPKSAFRELFQGENWHAWVAEKDGETIGYACIMIVANECHLANIAVVEKYRRNSVAKQFLNRILDLANDKDCTVILLEVRASNEPAIAFYKKYSFEYLYRRPKYYHHPVEDALVMVRELNSGRTE